jgi:predicted PurR-regulated permease PerM
MDTKKLQMSFFIGLLIGIVILAGAMFLPFLAPVALAIMCSVSIRPLHERVYRMLGERATLAALATTFFVFVVVFIPVSALVQRITSESYQLYTHVTEQGTDAFDSAIQAALLPVQTIFPSFNPDIRGAIEYVSSSIVENLGAIFSRTASIIMGAFLFAISLFYVLRDGKSFKRALVELSPLADAYDRQIIERLERAVNSVVRGSFLIAIVQGSLVALGFTIFGIPNAVLWGTVAAAGSFIPTVGTGIVVLPALIYLVVTGSTGAAIGLGIWSFAFVGIVDNVLLPLFVGKGFTVHPIFILFSIIGGVLLFGPVGVFLGPLIIALLFALLEIYKIIILDDQAKKITSI